MAQRGPQHEPLGPVVDGHAAVDHRREGPEGAGVGVGGAGDLPQADEVGVVLAGLGVAQHGQQVGLGLHDHHRDVEVGADPLGGAGDGPSAGDARARLAEREPRATAAVHEEAVVDPGVGVDAVDVGGEGEGRLRLADGQDLLDPQPAERSRRPDPQGGADLAVDVVGEGVAGVLERAVALGVVALEPRSGVTCAFTGVDGDRAALHPDALGRHPDPRHAGAHQLGGEERPVGVGVEPAAHVEPLDHDRAREGGGFGRSPHDHAGPVRRGGAWSELEAAVLAHLAVVDERAGHALGDELDLHPSDVGHVGAVGGGGEEGSPGTAELRGEGDLGRAARFARCHRPIFVAGLTR